VADETDIAEEAPAAGAEELYGLATGAPGDGDPASFHR
jgi:hypothetical protein